MSKERKYINRRKLRLSLGTRKNRRSNTKSKVAKRNDNQSRKPSAKLNELIDRKRQELGLDHNWEPIDE